MNNSDQQPPEEDELILSEFAERLRCQSVGGRPSQRDRILYECGFAAGIAARQPQSIKKVWPVTALVASLIACASLGTQFFTQPNEELLRARSQSINLQPKVSDQTAAARSESAGQSIVWTTLMRQRAEPSQDGYSNILRPTTRLPDRQPSAPPPTGAAHVPAVEPIQPRDIQKLLKEGV